MMNRLGLLFRSLRFYWRTNLAILLGVIAGTAVIGGALIVGDSVRGSLRDMSLDRLGDVDHALSSPRLIREDLARELANDSELSERFDEFAPGLVFPGSLQRDIDGEQTRRAGKLTVYGIDDRFWQLTDHGEIAAPVDDGVVVSRELAEELAVETGDVIRLGIELPATIPRDTLFGDRGDLTESLDLTITAILPDELGVARFGLQPNQQLPRNAFVALDTLRDVLGLGTDRSRTLDLVNGDLVRGRDLIPARVNAIFVSTRKPSDALGPDARDAAEALTTGISRHLTLDDLGLKLRSARGKADFALESRQMVLQTAVGDAAMAVADDQNLRSAPVLTYLANELHNASRDVVDEDNKSGYSMYSVVAGFDFPGESPFGSFDYLGPEPNWPLADDEIVLTDWLASDLRAEVGDRVRMLYRDVDSHGDVPEREIEFTVAGIMRLDGPAADSWMTPYVAGISDIQRLDQWEKKPFDMDEERITTRDELFWDKYRTTPKAYLSLGRAQELFSSRHGDLTSIRLAAPTLEAGDGDELEAARDRFSDKLLSRIEPTETGLVVQPVKRIGVEAAEGTTDFSGLFIGFSFFLILSAMILIGLLFRLGIERRAGNVGLLEAIGFSPAQVRRQLLIEGGLLVVIGGIIGTFVAVGYAKVMVHLLRTRWVGAIGTRFLDVHVVPTSLVIGFGIAAIVAIGAIWWAMRQLNRVPARELLAGEVSGGETVRDAKRRTRLTRWLLIGCVAISAVLVIIAVTGIVPPTEAFSGLTWPVVIFFLVGMLLLTATIAGLALWLSGEGAGSLTERGATVIARMGMRNAARQRQRSLLTVGLIASATFVIVAVAAGHRNPAAETPEFQSGNGGYLLVAESAVPILPNLNETGSWAKIERDVDDQRTADEVASEAEAMGIRIMPFAVKPGEEASCLNLYQTRRPTILGVPDRMIERGGFAFVGADRDNPWTLLNEQPEDGSIPVIGDMNSLMYSLHKSVGDQIPLPTEENPEYTLSIAGMLDGSVFQGVLLMSETNFRKLYPEVAGYAYFLVEGPPERTDEITGFLENSLAAYGFDAERTVDRIADFLAVQNTYLSTFLTLGGFGLLLGTLGLATVMLRNVLERRSELALMRAIGFGRGSLSAMVLWENAFLLGWGLLSGTLAALLAMSPHLARVSASIPWNGIGPLLVGVFALGMLAATVAVIEAVRTPILSTLRGE